MSTCVHVNNLLSASTTALHRVFCCHHANRCSAGLICTNSTGWPSIIKKGVLLPKSSTPISLHCKHVHLQQRAKMVLDRKRSGPAGVIPCSSAEHSLIVVGSPFSTYRSIATAATAAVATAAGAITVAATCGRQLLLHGRLFCLQFGLHAHRSKPMCPPLCCCVDLYLP